jgi:formylglycine-generating enzyme required for sulfatase activity
MSWRVIAGIFAATLFLGLGPLAHAQDPPESRVFVVIVGVEDYADPAITNLDYTEDDAQAVYDFFANSPDSPTTKDRVTLLRGTAATRVAMLSAIRDQLTRRATGPRDTAILYFAGHGFNDADGVYLATSDTQLGALQYTSVAWSDLQRAWEKISAGRRVLLTDACHSGGLKGLRGFGGITKAGSLVKASSTSASVLIAATAVNQLSVEDKRSKHGVFTASLLEGLAGSADKNRDGETSLGELVNHLKTQVPRRAKEAGGNQTPTIHFTGNEAFARQLALSRSKPVSPHTSGRAQLARLESQRRAAEKERESAVLRARLAEARLEKLQGVSQEEVVKAHREATRAKAEAAKARQAVERLRAEELKRIEAEARAAKAEAEAAELRRQLAELKDPTPEAAKAKREAEAEAARERERERELRAKVAAASEASARYARAIELAKRLKGFRYLGTESFGGADRSVKLARFSHVRTRLVFHLLPGGSYMRGSARGSSNARPVKSVTIQPFLICTTECTQAAWRRVAKGNPSYFKGSRRPVEQVSWSLARSFARTVRVRLPSEAEWEYACRAGSTAGYCYGDSEDELKRYAVYGEKAQGNAETQNVASKLPNAFGLFDMHGNVWEWCRDSYAKSYTGIPVDGMPWVPAGAPQRVYRGGSWVDKAEGCRSSVRGRGVPAGRGYNLGFRLAQSLR